MTHRIFLIILEKFPLSSFHTGKLFTCGASFNCLHSFLCGCLLIREKELILGLTHPVISHFSPLSSSADSLPTTYNVLFCFFFKLQNKSYFLRFPLCHSPGKRGHRPPSLEEFANVGGKCAIVCV